MSNDVGVSEIVVENNFTQTVEKGGQCACDILGIDGTGDIVVDGAILVAIEAGKSGDNVLDGSGVVLSVFVIGEADAEIALLNLASKSVCLVQNENDGKLDAPARIANIVKELIGQQQSVGVTLQSGTARGRRQGGSSDGVNHVGGGSVKLACQIIFVEWNHNGDGDQVIEDTRF